MSFGGGWAPKPVDIYGEDQYELPGTMIGRPKIVDRQAVLRQQLAQQQQPARIPLDGAGTQPDVQFPRYSREEDEAFKSRVLGRADSMLSPVGIRSIQGVLAEARERQDFEGQPPSAFGFASVDEALQELERPTSFQRRAQAQAFLAQRNRALTDSMGARDPLGVLYDAARTKIPYADRVAEQAGRVARTVVENQLPVSRLIDRTGLPSLGDVAEFGAESVIPTEAWMAVLELVPGAGTLPDLIRMAKRGTPEVLTELSKVVDNATLQRFAQRVLAEESGTASVDVASLGAGRFLRAQADEGGSSGAGLPARIGAAAEEGSAGVPATAPSPASGDVLPPTYRKLIDSMAGAVLTPKERKLAVQAGRARQGAKLREALETTGGSTVERAIAARAAQQGRMIPAIKPVGDRFEATEIDEIYRAVDEAVANKTIIGEEHPNAVSALSLLLSGRRVLDPDKPLNLMPHEIKLLGRIFGPEFEKALPRTPEELSLFQKSVDIANLPRAFIAGFDISAPGRQGILLAARNPVEWGKAWVPMIKAFATEGAYQRALDDIRRNPKFEDAVAHGIDFTEVGGGARAEETFASRLIQSNPILKQTVGRGERAYTTYLDTLRMTVYEKGASRLERTATKWKWAPERLEDAKAQWAGFVNHASGRGDMAALNRYTPTMNALFFSPRFLVSRPQAVWDLVRPGADPAVRQMVGENLGMFVGMGVTLLGAAAASGARVELDPRSSDFGKIRVGDQRFEFWAGYQPLARYIAQVATGDRKVLDTGEVTGVNRGKTMGRFLRSKLSPLGAMGYDLLVEGGRNYEGTNFLKASEVDDEAQARFMPLLIQSAIEGYQSYGPLGGAAAALGSAVGINVQTFEPDEDAVNEAEKSVLMRRLQEAGVPDRDSTFANSEGFRGAYANAFGVPVDKVPTDYREFREGMIKRAVEGGLSEAEATYRYDNHPFVRDMSNRLSEAKLQFWRAHPDLLREAIDAGVEGWSKEKEEILR